MLSFLLELGLDYKIVNNDGHNILTYLSINNNIVLLEYLLEHELNVNILNASKETALSLLAIKGIKSLDIVSLLLKYKASSSLRDLNNQTIIEKLIKLELEIRNNKVLTYHQDYLLMLKEILLNGNNNLGSLTSKGEPYFFDAVIHNNIELVKLLISHGCDIDQKDVNECNIIFKYISLNSSITEVKEQKNYHLMLRKIIALGANPNCRDTYGGTTLHKAILFNDLQTCKILINDGANIDLVDYRGRNMIHNIIWKKKIDILKVIHLLNKKLINKADKYGVLPINYAVFLGHHKLVLELIAKGAYINNPYKKSKSIQDFLNKLHKNIKPLLASITNKNDKNKVEALVNNMKAEFNINV